MRAIRAPVAATRVAIDPGEVRALAIEGGGGKGFAYLGAIKALQDLDVLRYSSNGLKVENPRCFFGASAGAITALYLACAYSPAEIEAHLKEHDYGKNFESPALGSIPGVSRLTVAREAK